MSDTPKSLGLVEMEQTIRCLSLRSNQYADAMMAYIKERDAALAEVSALRSALREIRGHAIAGLTTHEEERALCEISAIVNESVGDKEDK